MKLSKFFTTLLLIPGLLAIESIPAQANHNVVNGCGDDTGLGRLVPNAPTGADFRPACDNHDRCYGELSQSQEYCDRQFHNELLAECGRTFKTIVTRPLRATCNGVADTYFAAVQRKGGSAYRAAQAHARQEAFRWSQAGPIAGRTCTRIHEDGDPHAWGDNYLCSDRNFGLKWSQAGPIGGMKCTRIHEDGDPHAWGDNYLCVPNSSPINFRWSQAGSISGMTCTRVYEDADPNAWGDNYLCY